MVLKYLGESPSEILSVSQCLSVCEDGKDYKDLGTENRKKI